MNELTTRSMTVEEQHIFDEVDGVISRAVTIGDPLLVFEYGVDIARRRAMEGLALAKLLYRLEESWGMFQVAGLEDDMLPMVEIHMGIKPSTAKKYLDMWKGIFENPMVPEEIKTILSGRKISDLLLMTAAVREGQLSGEDLKAVALTASTQDLRDKIKEVRGEQTSSSSAIRLYLTRVSKGDMPAGTVYAQQGRKKEVLFKVKSEYGELGQQAMARFIRENGLIEEFA